MANINGKRTALYLKAGQTLPVPPANFLETAEAVSITPIFDTIDTNRIGGAMNSSKQYIDTCKTTVDTPIVLNMRGTGTTLDRPPEYGELLKIGGFNEVVNAGVSVEYTNNVVSIPNGSAIYFIDGNSLTMSNSLTADLEFNFTIGQPAQINAQLRGFLDSPEYVKVPNPTPTLSQEDQLIVSCADFIKITDEVVPAESVVIRVNPTIKSLYTMGGTEGIKNNTITDYALEVVATFYPNQNNINDESDDIVNQSFESLRVRMGVDRQSGVVDGQTITFDADLSQAVVYSDEISNDLLRRTVTYRLTNNASNEAIKITSGTQPV